MRFRATIKLSGKPATGIQVPADVVEGLGAGKKPPVKVTINGYAYRSSVAVMCGVSSTPTRERRIEKSVRTLREGYV